MTSSNTGMQVALHMHESARKTAKNMNSQLLTARRKQELRSTAARLLELQGVMLAAERESSLLKHKFR